MLGRDVARVTGNYKIDIFEKKLKQELRSIYCYGSKVLNHNNILKGSLKDMSSIKTKTPRRASSDYLCFGDGKRHLLTISST